MLRLTIITSTLNCSAGLIKTAYSIREQSYQNIQWIIADGLSKDGTIDVIRNNCDIVCNWFSAPDSGIYDAWNKACVHIDGSWVLFLGAGDTFESKDTLKDCCIKLLTVPLEYSFAFGGIKIQGKNKYRIIKHLGEFHPVWMDLNYSTPPHSSTFTRSAILKNNPFDSQFSIIGDRKFMNLHSGGKYYNLEMFVTIMDEFGISHDIKNIPVIWKENIMISKTVLRAPLSHMIKAYIINYRNVFFLRLFGVRNYTRWFRR
jgi:glycosyltransferase involved in cell wall biosynthesis